MKQRKRHDTNIEQQEIVPAEENPIEKEENAELQETASDDWMIPVKKPRPYKPKRMKKIRDAIEGRDIRYRGPLSYRHLRAIAWLLFALTCCGSILSLAYRIIPNLLPVVNDVAHGLSLTWQVAVPLFMLANFAVILHSRDANGKLLLRFGALSVIVLGIYLLGVYRYLNGALLLFFKSEESVKGMFDTFAGSLFPYGYEAFNIFIDLFLCALLTMFLYCRPKRVFTGRRVVILRLFALLPILYEVASIVLKILASLHRITLPFWSWGLLPTKPPIVFLVFLVLALHIKRRELSFRKHGFTHEEFRAYLKTNRNSLSFSVYTAVVCTVAAILDALAFLLLPTIVAALAHGQEIQSFIEESYYFMLHIGFGRGAFLIFLAPIALLFSYTKTYKPSVIDTLLPVFGVGISALISIEFIYQLIRIAPTL